MLPHPQARGGIEYSQHQLDHLQAQQHAAQQRMILERQRAAQAGGGGGPGNQQSGSGMMPPPGAQGGGPGGVNMQQYQREMHQQRAMQAAHAAVNQAGGGNPSVPPPPQQRVPLPPGPIPPSHPSHPQHQAWLAQQHRHQEQQRQQQQQQQQHLQQNGIGPPGSQPPLNGHGHPHPHMQHPQHPQHQQHPQMSNQQQQQQQTYAPPNQGSIAPQARTITSAVNLRNSQPPQSSLPPGSVNPANGPFAQPSSLPNQSNPNSNGLPHPPPSSSNPNSTPAQSPVAIRPPSNQIVGAAIPPPPHTAQSQQSQSQPPIQGQPRPVLRAQSQQASLALSAHLAVHGTGPISANAVPCGIALSKLLALTDALTFALEDESPLDSLRTVVGDYFTDAGVVKFGLYDKTAQLSKVFEIPCSAFPRFQHLNLLHGVLSSTLSPSFIREYRLTTPDTTLQSPSSSSNSAKSSTATAPNSNATPNSNNNSVLPQVHIGYLLRADEAVWTSRFASGTKVDLVGTLTVHFVFKDLGNGQPVLRVESFEFESRGHEEWVVREAMEVISNGIGGNLNGSTGLPPTTPGVGNEGGKDGSKGNSDSSKTGTTTTIKEESDSTEKSSNNETSRSRRSSNSTNAGGGRKGMTTRRRSASAREEQGVDEEENESSSTGQQDKSDKEKKDDNAAGAGGDSSAASREAEQAQQRRTGQTARVPASSVGSFGVTEMGMRCLEISESVAQLQDLISFSLETNIGPIQSLAQFAERRRNSLYGGPTTPSQPQQPSLPSYGPPPPSHQSQPNNAFYSSVSTNSPHPVNGNGYPTSMGPPPQRPPTAGSPATNLSNGNSGAGELMSPVALGPNGNGKRKLGNAPPGQQQPQPGTPHGMEEFEMNGSEPGSPQKVMRGGGRGRGRGRG